MSSEQRPIGSGFSAASTAADVIRGIDLSGKVAIVTGGSSGLGVETVRAIANAGATVLVPARNVVAASACLAFIDRVQIEYLDLLDPTSIDAFAARFLATGQQLHMLINSAGIMGAPLARDDRGFESHFATNHLAHFQLTAALWPALQRAEGARVVSVSSSGHRYSDVHFDDLHFEKRKYDPLRAYGQSKTGNVLFAVALDDRGRQHGVRAYALHPGSAVTPLARHTPQAKLEAMGVVDEHGRPVIDPSRNLKSIEQGASTAVWCATSPQLAGLGGVYCENNDIAPVSAHEGPNGSTSEHRTSPFVGVMPYALDRDAADRLWSVSQELVDLKFL
jgi:NAD(P)-dependent dehydrogenase (short-subunit alcohol dehydrogenase family)